MSATTDPDTEAGSPSPVFPSLADGNGGGVGGGGGAGGGGGGGAGGSWCVASPSASPTALQVAMDYACGHGADCSAIQQGGSCFNPDTVKDHASYAFNSYYQKNPAPTSCDFGGTATLTSTDPSKLSASQSRRNSYCELFFCYPQSNTAQILDKPYVSHGAFFPPSVQVQDRAGIHPQGKQNIYVLSKKTEHI
jgi:hypothetical protein